MKRNRIGAVTAGLLCLTVARAGPSWGMAGPAFESDPHAGKPGMPVEWVPIDGGRFTMGTDDGYGDEKPPHEVDIKTFEISRTLVTVEQYKECVTEGQCTEPDGGDHCNWGKAGRQRHPINCVDWEQAKQYAEFKGARLPSESEYEYAATSGGKSQRYPWGDEEATCERAVMNARGGSGCDGESTMPVCSKPAGSTAQGVCDMAGNVWEWMRDKYQGSYAGAPADGDAFEGAGSLRVVRGGSFGSADAGNLRAARRYYGAPGSRYDVVGFRLAR